MLEVIEETIKYEQEMKGIIRKDEAKVFLFTDGIFLYETLKMPLENY